MSIRSYYLNPDGNLQKELDNNEMKLAYESGKGLLWVDIEGDAEDGIAPMRDIFNFHRLAIDDCVTSLVHSPKVDDFQSYVFLIVHGINYTSESDIVETSQVELFIGGNYIVSHHSLPSYSCNAIQQLLEEDNRPMQRGADFLAYYIINTLINNVMPMISMMDEVADEGCVTDNHSN